MPIWNLRTVGVCAAFLRSDIAHKDFTFWGVFESV